MKDKFFVKDHSVSQENFQLIYDEDLDMYKTFPQPSIEQLPKYYESDDYISHTDSKRNLTEILYHTVRKFSLKNKLRLINQYGRGKNLLDVGCGTGEFLKIANENAWEIKGIEPDTKARALANEKTQNSVFDYDQLQSFRFAQFDVITLWHVLEHLPNLDKQISIFKSLLKEDGRLLIAVPNFNSYDANHYGENWAAFDAPRHLWHFSKTSIEKIFRKNGMVVEKHIPMKFDSFYVSLLSEKYKSGSSNYFNAFWQGLKSNLYAMTSGEYSSLIYVIKKA
ncbi:Methyltransferase domain-containing protein [Flavobacteriaceae bacterium MAR_2010_188]|nr:Methyltransferase domain-containing protein [Flavobacteriaceae bacterium MAR_2010_188]